MLPTSGGVYASRTARRLIPQTGEDFLRVVNSLSEQGETFGNVFRFQVDFVGGNYYISMPYESFYPNTVDKDRIQELYYFMYAI